ncbi:hypothetical protein HJC23_006183 [Cyclotella cryptica]|uniref:RNase III domain-containing protein n=1 Tax=Cyclotella cryptica TaxID=29204 RepID=A0ABD3Q077_9STRA
MPSPPLQLAFCHPHPSSIPSPTSFTVGLLPPPRNYSRWQHGKQLYQKGLLIMHESNQHSPNESPLDDICSKTTAADDPSLFFELMSPATTAQPDQMSASSLAYLGDVLFELFIRSRYVWPERRMSDLQNKVVSIVRADAQASLLKKFIKSFPLTPAEQTVLSRGRNANLSARKKMKGMGDSVGGASVFQDSTAFEALLGYAYIYDKQRFAAMINTIKLCLDESDSE